MQKFSRIVRVGLALFVSLFSTGIMQVYTAPNAAAEVVESVTFCHHNESDAWIMLETAPEVVFQAGHDTHQDLMDIIPPFQYEKQGETIDFAGLNYDAAGQATLENGCVTPEVVTPAEPTVTQPTCDVQYGILNLVSSEDYTYEIDGAPATNGMHLDAGTTVTVTAVASSTDPLFPDYATTYDFELTVDEAPTNCIKVIETDPVSVQGDTCGAGNDEVTVSTGEGYAMSNDTGWVMGDEGYTRTITYTADEGYVFSNESTTFVEVLTDNDEACIVTLPEITTNKTVVCGTNNDTISYTVDGIVYTGAVEAASFTATDSGWVNGTRTITLTAVEGYVFADETTEQELVFTDAATVCTGGKGQVGGESTTVTTTTLLPSTIPATGPSDSPQFLVYGLLASIFSYGAVYFAQPKRQLEQN